MLEKFSKFCFIYLCFVFSGVKIGCQQNILVFAVGILIKGMIQDQFAFIGIKKNIKL